MNSYRAFSQASLITVFAIVMASSAWPAPASAQFRCGLCYSRQENGAWQHQFLLGFGWTCSPGTCHSASYSGKCSNSHFPCYIKPMLAAEAAIVKASSANLEEVLATSDSWDYDAGRRTLSFTCSGYIVARYVLPAELASVAMAAKRPAVWPQSTRNRKVGTTGSE